MKPMFRSGLARGSCALAFGLLMSLMSAGCTVAGLAMGSASDIKAGRADLERLRVVPTGTRVTAWKTDDTSIAGRFDGLDSTNVGGDSDPSPKPRIRLRAHSGPVALDPDSVEFVTIPVHRGKVIGTLVGAALDVLVFFVVLVQSSGQAVTY